MLAHNQGSTAALRNLCLCGKRGFWEWTYTFPGGLPERGCDLLEFQGERIRVKNALRKVQGVRERGPAERARSGAARPGTGG